MTAAQDSQQPCRVCRADTVRDLLRIDGRRYLRCEGCEASFVASPDLPSAGAELAQYRLHQNDIDDRGYRRFLARLAQPLLARLAPGAWLGLMTSFQTDDSRFAGWHYRRDPTHVVFYRESTLRHLAVQRGWSCEIPARDVALMRKL